VIVEFVVLVLKRCFCKQLRIELKSYLVRICCNEFCERYSVVCYFIKTNLNHFIVSSCQFFRTSISVSLYAKKLEPDSLSAILQRLGFLGDPGESEVELSLNTLVR